ncbi:MAG: hypothetical protein KDI51_08720 [Xanthomonadales bacterium]|nr:hypothetical protein [Xanthomonadales bacterium]
MKRTLFPIALAVVLVAALASLTWPRNRDGRAAVDEFMPAPTAGWPGEDTEDGERFRERRQQWLDGMLDGSPGVQPELMDAGYRAERAARHQRERAAKLAAGEDLDTLKSFHSPAISGVWRERGSSNQAGRTNAFLRVDSAGRGLVLSDGGSLWLGDGDGFAAVNDSVRFETDYMERLVRNGQDRLVLPSELRGSFGVYYSDDWGASFVAATGLEEMDYIRGLAVRDTEHPDVYLLTADFAPGAQPQRPRLWHSGNAAESFEDLGWLDQVDTRTALFSPRYGSSEMFLLSGTRLSRIVPGSQALEPVGVVPIDTFDNLTRLSLTGGVDAAGQVFLYVVATYGAYSSGSSVVWRSLDGGVTFQRRGTAPTGPFSVQSIESSTQDPDVLLVGGVDLFRSIDGGSRFDRVNRWPEYYQSPTDKLHADIMNVDFFRNANGSESLWISTDGGTYRSDDAAATVQNLSLTSGLNVGQYYSSYTRRHTPHSLMVGSQDQGYQRVLNPSSVGVLAMEQVVSGDYHWLSSTDGGDTLWMVYPGFVMVDNGGALPRWSFDDNGLVEENFLPPLAAAPGQPNRALLGGGRVTSSSGAQLLELTLNNGVITHVVDPFVFPSLIGVVSYGQTAQDRYVLDYEGKFWRSVAGSPFAATEFSGEYFVSTDIVLDPVVPGRIYISGYGYGNPNVYVSNDAGQSFTEMEEGLPNTFVRALGISADGQHLFAATRAGAFYFDRAAGRWIDLTTAGAPNQMYMHVDYLDDQGVARFSTFGRGIWDFVVATPPMGPQDEPRVEQFVLPSPNPPNANCPAGYFTATVTDGPGEGIQTGIFGLALELDAPGSRRLAGGLNFGGLIDASQVGFAGVNIANAANEDQLLKLSVTGNPTADSAGDLPVRITINRRGGGQSVEVFQTSTQINGESPFTASVQVSPGYYETLIAAEGFPDSAAGGTPEGQFFFSLTTQFVDRVGGGFQGGAVVGGYHADNPFGGVSGFAAICIGTPHSITAGVYSAPTYGTTGAGDLQLQLLDAAQNVFHVVP